MFCCNCGKELDENKIFCDACGAKQKENDEVAPKENSLKSVNIFVVISAIIMALGAIIPCYSVSFFGMSESVSYIEGDGIFVIIAAVVAVVLAVIKKEKFACIPGAVIIVLLINFCSEISKVGIGSYGIGMYLMWIGAIAVCVTPFIAQKKK